MSEGTIEKIVAKGNVKIRIKDIYADTKKAEYDTSTEIILLQGKDSKITSGKNVVVADKITIDRKTNKIKAKSNKKKRV